MSKKEREGEVTRRGVAGRLREDWEAVPASIRRTRERGSSRAMRTAAAMPAGPAPTIM